MSSLNSSETWSLLCLVGACGAVLANTFQGDGAPLVASFAFSGLAFAFTYAFITSGFKGKELGKAVPKEM